MSNKYERTGTYRAYLEALRGVKKTPRENIEDFIRMYWGLIAFVGLLLVILMSAANRMGTAVAYDYTGRPCYAFGNTGALATRDGNACLVADCDMGGFGCGFSA